MLHAYSRALLLAFVCLKLHAAGRTENRSAPLDNIRHTASLQIHNFLIQKSLITLFNSFYTYSFGKRLPHYGTDSRIHPRSVAAAG